MPKITSDRIILLPSDRNEFKNVSMDIDLSTFRSYLNNAADGEPMRLFKMAEEIYNKDAMIGHTIDTRSKSVLGLDWQITSDNEQTSQDLEDFLRNLKGDTLNGIKDFNQFLATLTGVTYLTGVRVNELMYDNETFIGFNTIPSHFLTFVNNYFMPNLYNPDDMSGLKINKDKVAVHYVNTASEDYTKGYLAEALGWLYVFKSNVTKYSLKYAERYGQPLLLVNIEGDGDGYDKDAANASAIIRTLKVPGAVFSSNVTAEYIESGSSGNGELFESLNIDYDKYIQLRVLGQTSSAEAEDSNRSTAKEHMKVLNKIVQADAKSIENTVNDQVIPKILNSIGNFKDEVKFEFVFNNLEEDLIKAEVERAQIDNVAAIERVGTKEELVDRELIDKDSEIAKAGDLSKTDIRFPTVENEGFDREDKANRKLSE